jgi:hypothetical protein
VQQVVEGHSILFTLASHLNRLFAAPLLVVLTIFLCGSDGHVELCDLVSVLARRWDFDWTCPVEVEVAQCKSQMLDVKL